MIFIVYKTTNLTNGKIYVGVHQTESLIDDNYLGSGKYLRLAIKKYGRKNFKREVLHIYDNPYDMFDKEAEIVDELFVRRQDTYNCSLGGVGSIAFHNKGLPGPMRGKKHSELTKKKMSESHKGYIKSEEHRKHLSESHTGKTVAEETKEKLRQHNTGSFATEETKEKMSRAQKSRYAAAEAKKATSDAIKKKWQDPEYRERQCRERRNRKRQRTQKSDL